jgi:phage replication O-like protein O
MANPQKENGYTAIANEIMDNLCRLDLNGQCWKVTLFIIRKTYGFQKKHDRISLSQISDGTGISVAHVCRSLRILAKKGVISKKNGRIGLVKDHDKWGDKVAQSGTAQSGSAEIGSTAQSGNFTTAQSGNRVLPNQADTKETITKEIIKENNSGGKSSATKDGILYFKSKYEQKVGKPYLINYGKHGKMIKEMLGQQSLDDLKGLIDQLFVTKDQFITGQAGYSIEVLYTCANKLVQEIQRTIKPPAPPLSETDRILRDTELSKARARKRMEEEEAIS